MSEPTVLGMINKNLNDIKDNQGEANKSLTSIQVSLENHNVRMKNLEQSQRRIEAGQKKIKKDLYEHIGDKKKHHIQGYKETIPQKLVRKKLEISIITIITTVIGWLVNNYFGG